MDLNHDPLYPDQAVTDQTLHVWARHAAYCNKPAFIWIDDEAAEDNEQAPFSRRSSTLSYSALDSAASTIAKHLHEAEGLHGLIPGHHVLLVLYPPGLSFIKLLFGCLRANLCIAPLLPPPSLFDASIFSPAHLAHLLQVVKQLKPFAVLAPSSCSPSYTKHLLSHGSLKLLRWIFIDHAQLDSVSAASTLSDAISSLTDKQGRLSNARREAELTKSSLECDSTLKYISLSNHRKKVQQLSLSPADSLSKENINIAIPADKLSHDHQSCREDSERELGSTFFTCLSTIGSAPSDKVSTSNDKLSQDKMRDLECSSLSTPPHNKLCHDKHSYGFDRRGLYKGCSANDVYLVQYTSGATGPPKPTLISAGAATHNARVARKAYDLNPSSIIVSWLPQYHDCGLMFIHLSIITGTTSILTSPFTFSKNPLIWLHMLSHFKATCTPTPSFALPLISRKLEFAISKGLPLTPSFDLSSLRNLLLINEPIEKDVVDSFLARFTPYGLHQASIAPSYGLAENCTFVSTSWAKDDDLEGSYPTYMGLLPSAREGNDDNDEVEIRVVHIESCYEAVEGSEGEIWVASSSNAKGYLGLPELTSQVFEATMKSPYACEHGLNKKLFVRTGDFGVSRGGFIYIIGRVKDMLVCNGQRVHPHVIERLVQESASMVLRPGGIVALSIESSSTEVACGCTLVILAEMREACMCKAPNDVLQTICQALQKRLTTPYSYFVGLLKARALPKTTSGKLQRWKAKKLFTQNLLYIPFSTSFTLSSKI